MDNEKITEEEFKIPIEGLFPKFREHLAIKKIAGFCFLENLEAGKHIF